MKIFIELDFEETPSQADVENYLNELMSNNCLDWYTDTEEKEDSEDTSILEDMKAVKELSIKIEGGKHDE